MDRETILEKSRKENRNKDLFKQEVEEKATGLGVMTAAFFATLFFVVQVAVGKGIHLGLYAILFSMGAVQFAVKAYYLRRKREIILAVLYSILTLALSAIHLYNLIGW